MQKTDSGGGGGTDYIAGKGIKISGDKISVDSKVVALKTDKTKVAESSINGNVKVDSAEVQVYRLPIAYEEYLETAYNRDASGSGRYRQVSRRKL